MKGLQFAVLGLFWMICVSIIFFGTNIGLRAIGGGRAYELPVKIEVYSMQNALDASKVYMDTALRYSIYQACYDNLANGGWPDIMDVPVDDRVVVGDKSYGPIRTSGEFRADLLETVRYNVNQYSAMGYSFFETYDVKLPSYDSAEFLGEPLADALTVKAGTGGVLQLCKPEDCKIEGDDQNVDDENGVGEAGLDDVNTDQQPNIRETVMLRKSAGLQETVETPCYDIYREGVDEAERLGQIIEQELQDEIDSMLEKDPLLADVVDDSSACNTLVDLAKSRITTKLESDSVEILEIVLNVVYAGYDSLNKICMFDEMGPSTATVLVTIDGDPDKTFPVWNGQELAFEPLKLMFVLTETYEA